ncbi:alpha/beta hydrolase [Nocardia terpenica]|uniref:alpha/beta hydrolase n=1 Tax=Nocardia terpenica TaxID=455432 RepID=UPI002B4B7442|nr:alpha/beta fold hydrolase [Nocardia terpenica]
MTGEEIEFDSGSCRLAGTFIAVSDPVAVALVLPGSGRADRDSNVPRLPLGLTRDIAQALTGAGVATLRYDKRGIGASGGEFLPTGFHQQLADARAALAWLAARVPGVPVLVVGHSEGGLHAIELAADGSAAGAVLLSTAARTGEEVLLWQGVQLVSTLPRWLTTILRWTRIDPLVSQRKRLARIERSSADVLRIQGVRMNARWLREFAAYDPRPALARIGVPVLAITGAHDMQVPPDGIDTMGQLVRGSFEGHVLDDLSHLLRPDPDRIGPRGYRRAVRQPVSPEPLNLITDWITRYWHP